MKRLALITMCISSAACRYAPLPQLTADAQSDIDPDASTDALVLDDAQTVDAPGDGVGHTCYVPDDLQVLTLGTSTTPLMSDWFDTSGPQAVFKIAARLPGAGPVNLFVVSVVKPISGFPLNQSIPFVTTYNANATETTSDILANVNQTNGTYTQFFLASNGSIQFTAIGQASNDLITGTVTMTDYREVNQTTGISVNPGCTTKLGSMAFHLRQM